MQLQFSIKVDSENLYGMKGLREILYGKEVDVTSSDELETCSSAENLPVVSSTTSSICEAIDGVRLLKGTSKYFTDMLTKNSKRLSKDSRPSSSNKVVMRSSKENSSKSMIRSNSDRGKQVMRSSKENSSKSMIRSNSDRGKQVVQASEVEQLSKRLKTLEEEAEIIREELFEYAEDRKFLLDEIYQLFQILYS